MQFSFDGVEDGRYPNGTPFHIGNLVTPKLVSALYDLHDLAERDVARTTFASAFAIEPYSPERDYIIRRREELAERGTPSELLVLQEQLTAELRRAGAGAARLSFRPLSPLPLTQEDIGKLLLDLPRLWAEEATEQYGVFGPDVPVYSPALFDLAETQQLDYIAALDAIQRKATTFLGASARRWRYHMPKPFGIPARARASWRPRMPFTASSIGCGDSRPTLCSLALPRIGPP